MGKESLWEIKDFLRKFPNFTEYQVRWWIRKGYIPYKKIGRRIYFIPKQLYEWFESSKTGDWK